jgi:signal transduction histidine kinase
MNNDELLKLSKEELISLIKETEQKFASSNVHAAELLVQLDESYEELKKLHEQQIHHAKLISIGELASGVGHEINNPLAIISGHIEIIKKQLAKNNYHDEKVDKYLQNCTTSVKRIAAIINSLRSFSRKDELNHFEVINCHEAITQNLDLLKIIYEKEGVQINLDLKATKAEIKGIMGEFQQVIMNLLSNAKDATKGKKDRLIKIESLNEENNIIIKVSDNGHGIEKENLERIFDSFFTTKPKGEGTGLGLSLSSQLVKNMNGMIKVDSDVGAGTTFSLHFEIHS